MEEKSVADALRPLPLFEGLSEEQIEWFANHAETITLAAASLSIDYKLPMADAIIYATARAHQAELITSDAHFSGLPGVTLI